MLAAKETASSAPRQVGIGLFWAECPILDRVIANRVHRAADTMRYALVAGEINSIPTPWNSRGAVWPDRGAILGGIIAHEIGHMRAVWQDQDLDAKACSLFSGEQAVRIAEAINQDKK